MRKQTLLFAGILVLAVVILYGIYACFIQPGEMGNIGTYIDDDLIFAIDNTMSVPDDKFKEIVEGGIAKYKLKVDRIWYVTRTNYAGVKDIRAAIIFLKEKPKQQ